MIINQVNISNIQDLPTLMRFLSPFCSQVSQALANGLNFQDNIRANYLNIKFPIIANQNMQILHGLHSNPIGYLTIRNSAGGIVYDGSGPVLGATFANLKCNVAGMTATILFF